MTTQHSPSGAQEHSLRPSDYPQWIVWREEHINGRNKPTKVPYQATLTTNDPPKASATNPATWTSYPQARAVCDSRGFDGIGFVFTREDPFVGVDLDDVLDEATGEIDTWAQAIVDALDSYTEVSPSGTGLHIITAGTLPPGGRAWGEGHFIADSGRYFTMTGQTIGTPARPVAERQAEIEKLHASIFPKTEPAPALNTETRSTPLLDDHEIISRATNAANGDRFVSLYVRGDTTGYESKSEADHALIDRIAFWTGPDPDRIFNLFMQSALGHRDKVRDRPKYLRDSINKALLDISAFYDPNYSSAKSAHTSKPFKEAKQVTGVTGVTGDSGHVAVTSGQIEPTSPQELQQSPLYMRFVHAEPFPVEVLPGAARLIVEEAVASMDCPADLVGVPVLATMASAIGASRAVALKEDWVQYSSLFMGVIASPGSMKTPAAEVALQPLYDIQKEQVKEYEEKMEAFEERERDYELEKTEAKKAREVAPPPPKEPDPKQSVASDTTIEGLVNIFVSNPRGFIIDYDELSGWIRSMDQYKGGKGGERQHWLSIWGSKSINVNRAGKKGVTFVERPVISIFGGIQPALLGELGGANTDGLMDRFLFAYPTHKSVRVKDETINRATKNSYASLVEKLSKLQGAEPGKPRIIGLAPEAWTTFKERANSLSEETEEPGFPTKLEALWAKLRGYLGRLALVLYMARVTAGDLEENVLEVQDIEAAWQLILYFKHHARRVHGVIEQADPLDVFVGHVKTMLEGEEEDSWGGSATALVERLELMGVADVPAASAIKKRLDEAVLRSSDLHMIYRRTNKGSYIELSKVTPEVPVSPVTTYTPVTPKDAKHTASPPQAVARPVQPEEQPVTRTDTANRPCKHSFGGQILLKKDCSVCKDKET